MHVTQGRQSEPTLHCQRVRVDEKRDCVSWIDDDLIVFEDDSRSQQEDCCCGVAVAESGEAQKNDGSETCGSAQRSDFTPQRSRTPSNVVGGGGGGGEEACVSGRPSRTANAVQAEGSQLQAVDGSYS